jgi:hypothetical protein
LISASISPPLDGYTRGVTADTPGDARPVTDGHAVV